MVSGFFHPCASQLLSCPIFVLCSVWCDPSWTRVSMSFGDVEFTGFMWTIPFSRKLSKRCRSRGGPRRGGSWVTLTFSQCSLYGVAGAQFYLSVLLF